jgi:hypothetical protein
MTTQRFVSQAKFPPYPSKCPLFFYDGSIYSIFKALNGVASSFSLKSPPLWSCCVKIDVATLDSYKIAVMRSLCKWWYCIHPIQLDATWSVCDGHDLMSNERLASNTVLGIVMLRLFPTEYEISWRHPLAFLWSLISERCRGNIWNGMRSDNFRRSHQFLCVLISCMWLSSECDATWYHHRGSYYWPEAKFHHVMKYAGTKCSRFDDRRLAAIEIHPICLCGLVGHVTKQYIVQFFSYVWVRNM